MCGGDAYEPCTTYVDDLEASFHSKTAMNDEGYWIPTMGIGKGGKIGQKIYPDPYGLEAWKPGYASKIKVAVVNSVQYAEMTNSEMPPMPRSVEEYIGMWYGVKDKEMGDVKGTDSFDKLKFSTQV